VPDSGPLFAINGQRFIDGIRLYYGSGPTDYVDVTHPGLSSAKAHWRETVYAPESITNATEAANLAETILQERSQDGRTFMLSVCHANGGPLTDAQVGSIKPGMLISIKARVLPFFLTNGQPNYTYYSTRIVSLQWHMPLPGQYFATLKLERPERTFGVGVPPGPRPPGEATAASCALDPSNMTAISTPNGDVELGDATNWSDNFVLAGDPFGIGGSWYQGTGAILGGGFAYYWPTGTWTSGQTYVCRFYMGGSGDWRVRFGNEADLNSPSGDYGELLAAGLTPGLNCIEWTPSATRTDAGILFTTLSPGSLTVDGVTAYTGSGGDVPADVGAVSDPGTETGVMSPIDHVHGHGTHTADYHTNYVQENVLTAAGDVPYATGASTWTRLPIGSSNFHMRSDGTKPVWSPESPALTNPMDAVGDLIRGGAAGAPTKLAIGASNFAFKSTGTIPEWSNTLRLSYIDLDEHTLGLPPSPPAGAIRLYGSNSKGYYENSSGTVVELGGAGGAGGISGIAVEEDGVEEGATITRFDFTTGLNVSVSGSQATISADAAGGGSYTIGSWSGATQQTVTGTAVWTEGTDEVFGRDVLSVVYDDQSTSDLAAILKAIGGSSPRRIQTAIRMMGPATNYAMAGLVMTDGTTTTSNCIYVPLYTPAATREVYLFRTGTLTNFDPAFTTYATLGLPNWGPHLHLRLTWLASNSFRAEFSPDAVSWTTFGVADPSVTFTPTHVGFAVSTYGNTVPRIATFEYWIDEAA
jgi:hypothetical protein